MNQLIWRVDRFTTRTCSPRTRSQIHTRFIKRQMNEGSECEAKRSEHIFDSWRQLQTSTNATNDTFQTRQHEWFVAVFPVTTHFDFWLIFKHERWVFSVDFLSYAKRIENPWLVNCVVNERNFYEIRKSVKESKSYNLWVMYSSYRFFRVLFLLHLPSFRSFLINFMYFFIKCFFIVNFMFLDFVHLNIFLN